MCCEGFLVSIYNDLEYYMRINNGAHLAWLIDPKEEKSYIYRKDSIMEVIEGFDKKLSGEDVLPDFELDLKMLLPA